MNKTDVVKSLRKAEREFGLAETLHRVFGKNIAVSIPFSETACKTPVEELVLSVRSYNALRRSNIKTLGDLIARLNAGEIKNIRSLGTKSYSEIQTKVLLFGYERLSDAKKDTFFLDLLEENGINRQL